MRSQCFYSDTAVLSSMANSGSHIRCFKRPFQPSISAYFDKVESRSTPLSNSCSTTFFSSSTDGRHSSQRTDGANLPVEIQISLLQVGMRVRKAVAGGYNAGKEEVLTEEKKGRAEGQVRAKRRMPQVEDGSDENENEGEWGLKKSEGNSVSMFDQEMRDQGPKQPLRVVRQPMTRRKGWKGTGWVGGVVMNEDFGEADFLDVSLMEGVE